MAGLEDEGVVRLSNLEVVELKSLMDEDFYFLKKCWSESSNLKSVTRDGEIISD